MKLIVICGFILSAIISCHLDEMGPVGPAPKVTADDDEACFVVEFDCQPEGVYTLFYSDWRLRVRVDPHEVQATYYVDDHARIEYQATPQQAALARQEGRCGLWSEAFVDTTLPVVLYEGDLKLAYRGLPDHRQLQVAENDTLLRIARVLPDSSILPVRFDSFAIRFYGLVKPPSLGESLFYLPTNLDTVGWSEAGKTDVRPHLINPFCDAECADWNLCPRAEEPEEIQPDFSFSSASAEEPLPEPEPEPTIKLYKTTNPIKTEDGFVEYVYPLASPQGDGRSRLPCYDQVKDILDEQGRYTCGGATAKWICYRTHNQGWEPYCP